MRIARRNLAAIALLVSGISRPAFGETEPTAPHSFDQLMSPARVAAMALSPTGRHVAYALRDAGSKADVIHVVNVERPESIAAVSRFELVIGEDGGRAMRLWWVDDSRVIAEIGTDYKVLRQRILTGFGAFLRTIHQTRLYSFDALHGGSGLPLDERLQADSILADATAVPGTVSVQVDGRRGATLYRLDARSGALSVIEEGDPATCCWRVIGGRAVMKINWRPYTSAMAIYRRSADAQDDWVLGHTFDWAETVALDLASIADAPEPMQAYLRLRPDGADKYGVYVFDWSEGNVVAKIAERSDFDLDSALVLGNRLLATEYTDDRFKQDFVESDARDAYQALERRFGPDNSIKVHQVSADGDRWLLSVSGPRFPTAYHVFDVSEGRLGEIVADYSGLDSTRLATSSVLRFATADAIELTAYLTCPAWRGDAMLPLVVIPPAGPADRSSLRYDPEAQAFAAQGWCVLKPTSRGIQGYGLRFEEMGYGQWSERIAQDIVDSVQVAVDQGIARPDAIAIFARRLGAYAALSGAIRHQKLFHACVTRDAAVDLDLVVNELRMRYPKFSPIVQEWTRHRGEESRRNSPLARADELSCPTLLIHREGANDVSIGNSEALGKKRWLPVAVLPHDRTWAQEMANEQETIRLAIRHLQRFLPHGSETAVRRERPLPDESTPQALPEAPPAVASLDNCIQPAAVDRETCLGRIRIGMSRGEVEAVLGPADATTRDGTTVQYGDRYLKFDGEGKLVKLSDEPL